MDKLKKAFANIYDQYIDKIYRFIFLKVNSQETAQDLTSETFLRGWESFKNKKLNNQGEIENIQAFLYQIARNLVTDHYREKGKFQVVSADFSPIIDPQVNLEEKAFLNSDFEAIRQTIGKLNEDYQNALIWYYLDDLPVPEIAKMLDRSEEATRVLLHRALKTLREQLNSA